MKRLLFVVLVILASSVAVTAQVDTGRYFLRMEGKGALLERVAVNGNAVLSGTLISVGGRLRVTQHLKAGMNTLEIVYRSHPTEGLAIVIEREERGSSAKEEVVRFSSAAGETQGERVTRTVSFTVGPKAEAEQPTSAPSAEASRPRPKVWTEEDLQGLRRKSKVSTVGTTGGATSAGGAEVMQSLAEADKQAILALVQAHYQAAANKDGAAWARLYERAMQEEGEEMDLARHLVNQIFPSPAFRMKPLQLEGLQFTVQGQMVTVSRSDGQPVFDSEEVTWQEGPKARGRARYNPAKLFFKKYGGQWHHTIPF